MKELHLGYSMHICTLVKYWMQFIIGIKVVFSIVETITPDYENTLESYMLYPVMPNYL